MEQRDAVPGLRGMQHVGVAVPDLAQAVAFFQDVFGARLMVRGGTVEAEDAWMADHLGAAPDSRLTGLALLRIGNGTNLELLEYRSAGGIGEVPAASANAATHVAFEVDDIEAAVTALRAHGVSLLNGPGHITEGDLAGMRWIYLRTPWGQIIELLSAPDGFGYTRGTTARLWDPKNPAA